MDRPAGQDGRPAPPPSRPAMRTFRALRSAAALTALLAAPTVLPATATAADTPGEEFFETKVRPLLVKRCVGCHGPEKQQGEVRLDSRAAVMGGSAGPLVLPGKVAESRILQVVRFSDDDTQMPPKGKLPAEEIAVLTEWVRLGAPWPASADAPKVVGPTGYDFERLGQEHWAFRPVVKPVPPDVRSAVSESPVDRFVLARLEAAGLSLSPPADKRTLLRRVTFDLTGLPPTADEAAAFEADDAPDAFARVVDRLLASPLYGQRWGRHWLDVARYADTKGYVFTEEMRFPYSYTYRDYVVSAFNADKPYDRFVIEQIAADRLGLPADAPELAALGFLTVGRRNLNRREDILDDRIDVTCRGLMGLTVACARCHDHKFDPIPTADYYSLYGVFDSSDDLPPAEMPQIGEPQMTPEYAEFLKELGKRQSEVDGYVGGRHAAIVAEMSARAGEYLRATVREGDAGTDGQRIRPEGRNAWKRYLDQAAKPDDRLWGLWKRLAGTPDGEFAEKSRQEIETLRSAPAFQEEFAATVLNRLTAEPIGSFDDLARHYGSLIAAAGQPGDDATLKQVAERLKTDDAPPFTPVDRIAALFQRDERDHERNLQKKVDEFRATSLAAPPRAMAVRDRPNPVEPVVFVRGNVGRRGDKVPRQFLRIIAGSDRQPFPKDQSGRLDLARAVADPANPLTARVLVNRVWQHHFGEGLVRTPSDFGARAEPPTHPELLDWLAAEFTEGGWSIKRLHRAILLSATYRQGAGSRDQAAGVEAAAKSPNPELVDPENKLLWHMNRRRLTFEAMRDSFLCVAGRLDPAIGGRPVEIVSADSPRRSVYGFVNRNDLPGLLRSFDFPSPDASSAGRTETTVPQQALYGMNSPFVTDQAKSLAARPEVTAAGDDSERVERLYRLALGRAPSSEERALAMAFLASPVAPGAGLNRTEQLSQVLLLTNEFFFVD